MEQVETPAVDFSQVTKRYRKQVVLDGLELSVARGEFFALVGLNGAGKTTCIKALLDFCQVDGGTITLFGVPHTETRSRAPIAYLPERFLPPHYLTGSDFLKYMARLHGGRYREAAVLEMLAVVDLQPSALAQPVREYSKGMGQKLGLAACFLSGKPLYVFDEPFSGLDPKARLLVKQHLLALKERGHTLFFSTHLLSDVGDLCHRMGVLHAGKVRFAGTPARCRAEYGVSSLEQAFLACISNS